MAPRQHPGGLVPQAEVGDAAHPGAVLPADATDHFQAASLVLYRFGLNVAGGFAGDAGHEVVMTRTIPLEGVEYRHVLSDMGPADSFSPRMKAAYFCGAFRVTICEPSPARPVVEVSAPRPGPIHIAVLDADVALRVSIGERAYRLVEGELVEEDGRGEFHPAREMTRG